MMKKYKFVFFWLIVLVCSSCKRYEEDPITFRTPENRIRRQWKLIEFTLDGKDSMDFVTRNRLDGKWKFGNEYDQGSRIIIESIVSSGNGYNGYWTLDDDKEKINFSLSSFNSNLWFDISKGEFHILKLTTKEFKIQHDVSRAILYFRS